MQVSPCVQKRLRAAAGAGSESATRTTNTTVTRATVIVVRVSPAAPRASIPRLLRSHGNEPETSPLPEPAVERDLRRPLRMVDQRVTVALQLGIARCGGARTRRRGGHGARPAGPRGGRAAATVVPWSPPPVDPRACVPQIGHPRRAARASQAALSLLPPWTRRTARSRNRLNSSSERPGQLGRRGRVPLLCPPRPFKRSCRAKARRNHDPRVGGSSPSSGTSESPAHGGVSRSHARHDPAACP